MKVTNLIHTNSTHNDGEIELDTFYSFQSNGYQLKQIVSRHGDIVDGLRFCYGDTWTPWCGSCNTGGETTIKFADGEYITRISGKIGNWFTLKFILQLTIYTSKGNKYTLGKADHSTNVSTFDFDYANSYILGFSLKSQYQKGHYYISDIGIYYIEKELEFIGLLCNILSKNREKHKNIILQTYRIGKVYNITNQINKSDPISWYYDKLSTQNSEEDKYILTLAMLTYYNDTYKNCEIKEGITSFGLVSVGKRLWQYQDLIGGDNIFPNIRFMPMTVKELDAYDSSYATVKKSQIFSLVSNGKTYFRVGSSSLADATPVFEGTRKLQNSNFGLKSTNVSDYPYEGTISLNKTKENILNALQWVIDNEVAIWLLPEMCMDNTLLAYLRELLQQKKEKLKNLKMIVPGSIYQKVDDEKYCNQAPIWIIDENNNLVELTPYDKRVPFSMNTPSGSSGSPDINAVAEQARKAGCNIIAEDLENGIDFRIVRFEKGYIGIAVCRDVLDLSEKCNPLNRYCDFVDIMLVISMNSGHTNCFTSTAESMSRWHNCATIYNNNMTSVLNKEDKTVELSFAIQPKVTSAAGIKGEIYYRSAPIVRMMAQLKQSKENTLTQKQFMSICDAAVNSIYSGGVVAKNIPDDGNVFYDITV